MIVHRCLAPIQRGGAVRCRRPVRHEGDRCHFHPRFVVSVTGVGLVIELGTSVVLESGRLGSSAKLSVKVRDGLELARAIQRAVEKVESEAIGG